MTLRGMLALSCLLLPLMASAHNFKENERVHRWVSTTKAN